jgi:hypothetical protein
LVYIKAKHVRKVELELWREIFSSLLGFVSSLPQLAWDKRLCCCTSFSIFELCKLCKK